MSHYFAVFLVWSSSVFAAAEASPTMEWIAPIVQTGAVGGVLLWFMFRNEKSNKELSDRMKSLERSQDRATRANLLVVITLGNATVKEQARQIISEIDGGQEGA